MQKVFTKREKTIFFITIGIVIFSIVFSFLLLPVFREYAQLNNEVNIVRFRLKKYLRLASRKDYLEDKQKKFAAGLNFSVDTGDASVATLSALEELTKEANIKIIDIRPQSASGRGLSRELVIDLRTEGAMEGYLKFLYNIEHSLLLLTVKKFQMSARLQQPALQVNLSVSQAILE